MDIHRRRNPAGSQRSAEEAAINKTLDNLEGGKMEEGKRGTSALMLSVPEASRSPSSIHEPEPNIEIEETQAKYAIPAASSQLARSLENNLFWSPKTQAEFQLRQKRSFDLDE